MRLNAAPVNGKAKASVLICLLVSNAIVPALSVNFRGRSRSAQVPAASTTPLPPAGLMVTTVKPSIPSDYNKEVHRGTTETVAESSSMKIVGNPIFKVLKEEGLTLEGQGKCLCYLGEFWHWRIKRCVPQGGWGYECGFFPHEHHRQVCQDGYHCKPLEGAIDNYVSHGTHFGSAGAFPATCLSCQPEDNCRYGNDRRGNECLQQTKVSGEACVKVEVTLPAVVATASSTQSHNASVSFTKEVEAHAVAAALKSAESTVSVEREAEAEATDSATASATVKRAAHAVVSKTAEASDTASRTATATKVVKVKGSAKVGSVTAAVTKKAKSTATHTAKATVTARETATKEADAMAERTASGDATIRRLAKATATGTAHAADRGYATAVADIRFPEQVTANAVAQHTETVTSNIQNLTAAAEDCVSAEEIMADMGIKDPVMSPVLANEVNDAALKKAFENAAAKAKALAAQKGIMSAQAIAEATAAEEAKHKARMKAEAEARDMLAWEEEETGSWNGKAQAAAQAQAQAKAHSQAKAQAQAAAQAQAQAKADAAASAEAQAKANAAATAEAGKIAAEEAAKKAAENAKKEAQADAQAAAAAKASTQAAEEAEAAAQADAQSKAAEAAAAEAASNAADAAKQQAEKGAEEQAQEGAEKKATDKAAQIASNAAKADARKAAASQAPVVDDLAKGQLRKKADSKPLPAGDKKPYRDSVEEKKYSKSEIDTKNRKRKITQEQFDETMPH